MFTFVNQKGVHKSLIISGDPRRPIGDPSKTNMPDLRPIRD